MIDLDTTAGREERRPRKRIYLAVAAAVLSVAVAATAFTLYASSAGDKGLRLEVDTRSGTALQIRWNVEMDVPKPVTGDPLPMPWSTTLDAPEEFQLGVTLSAFSTDTDLVTCRIFLDGELVSENSRERAAICGYHPKVEQMVGEMLESETP
ncbi:hypothetical protein AB0F81_13355 [Actinoplanes sp. NPDC024001]|uniref:hypothetical protein n=1 Tax=Actinoplanes sp. NPDC024001 TaxID=3154598 RepID=UPI0033ECC7CD